MDFEIGKKEENLLDKEKDSFDNQTRYANEFTSL